MAFQDDYIRTAIRLPRDLHADIQLAAEKAGRSMNAELIARLYDSFSCAPKTTDEIDSLLGAYQAVIAAFKATSDDFEKEMAERMARFLSTIPSEVVSSEKANEQLRKALGLK